MFFVTFRSDLIVVLLLQWNFSIACVIIGVCVLHLVSFWTTWGNWLIWNRSGHIWNYVTNAYSWSYYHSTLKNASHDHWIQLTTTQSKPIETRTTTDTNDHKYASPVFLKIQKRKRFAASKRVKSTLAQRSTKLYYIPRLACDKFGQHVKSKIT